MISEDALYNLIEQSIEDLASESVSKGAESLEELAVIFAKAGMYRSTFNDIRKHIVDQAKQRTDALFIEEKLKLAERKLTLKRSTNVKH